MINARFTKRKVQRSIEAEAGARASSREKRMITNCGVFCWDFNWGVFIGSGVSWWWLVEVGGFWGC